MAVTHDLHDIKHERLTRSKRRHWVRFVRELRSSGSLSLLSPYQHRRAQFSSTSRWKPDAAVWFVCYTVGRVTLGDKRERNGNTQTGDLVDESGLLHHIGRMASLSQVCTSVTSFKRIKCRTQLSPTLFRVWQQGTAARPCTKAPFKATLPQ